MKINPLIVAVMCTAFASPTLNATTHSILSLVTDTPSIPAFFAHDIAPIINRARSLYDAPSIVFDDNSEDNVYRIRNRIAALNIGAQARNPHAPLIKGKKIIYKSRLRRVIAKCLFTRMGYIDPHISRKQQRRITDEWLKLVWKNPIIIDIEVVYGHLSDRFIATSECFLILNAANGERYMMQSVITDTDHP